MLHAAESESAAGQSAGRIHASNPGQQTQICLRTADYIHLVGSGDKVDIRCGGDEVLQGVSAACEDDLPRDRGGAAEAIRYAFDNQTVPARRLNHQSAEEVRLRLRQLQVAAKV